MITNVALLSLLLLSGVAPAVSEQERIRCFVCPGAGNSVEALDSAPTYAEKCAQVLVELPGVCGDLLKEERLKTEKDRRIEEASLLDSSGDRVAAMAKKGEVAVLWKAYNQVRDQTTEKMWGDLMKEMDT